MGLDRADGHAEAVRDLRVGVVGAEEGEHLRLAPRDPLTPVDHPAMMT
jgi:hypothetical protein